MATNATGLNVVQTPLCLAMECFDRLPRPLRDALNYAPVPFDPVQLLDMLARVQQLQGDAAAERQMLDAVRRTEHQELQRFALAHLAEHGDLLPHIAAEATTMRALAR